MSETKSTKQGAPLTREEKLARLDLIQEKKRRQREARALYQPNDGQLPVHLSKAKVRLVVTGNGGGKTTLGANEAMWSANGYSPVTKELIRVPRRVVVVLDHPDKVKDKWLPEIRKWYNLPEERCHKDGKPYVCRISFPNGSEIKFMFHEQSPLVFESIELDDGIFDEPPPRDIYIALLRGMRNRDMNARVLIIGTPITGSWLREEIYDPWAAGEAKDTECFRYGSEVNEKNLPDGHLEWFGSKLSEKEKLIRLKGHFFDLEGLALAHLLSRAKHIVDDFDWPEDWPCVVVYDPAPSKAHVAVVVGVDDCDQLYVIDEYANKVDGRTFSKETIELGWFHKYRVIDIVYDSLGSSENLMGEAYKPFGVLLNEELSRAGIGRARATRVEEKDDEDFIERIRDALLVRDDNEGRAVPKLRFFRRASRSYHDCETVKWYEDKQLKENKKKLDIRKKDFLACIKYALATNLYHKKKKEKAYVMKRQAYGMTLPSQRKSLALRARKYR